MCFMQNLIFNSYQRGFSLIFAKQNLWNSKKTKTDDNESLQKLEMKSERAQNLWFFLDMWLICLRIIKLFCSNDLEIPASSAVPTSWSGWCTSQIQSFIFLAQSRSLPSPIRCHPDVWLAARSHKVTLPFRRPAIFQQCFDSNSSKEVSNTSLVWGLRGGVGVSALRLRTSRDTTGFFYFASLTHYHIPVGPFVLLRITLNLKLKKDLWHRM